jgi:hypothetical protein
MSNLVEQFNPEWVFCFNPKETDVNYIYSNEGKTIKMNAFQHTNDLNVGDWAVIKRSQGSGLYPTSDFIALCQIVDFEEINGTDPEHEPFANKSTNRGRLEHQPRYHSKKAVLQVNLLLDDHEVPSLTHPQKYQGCVHRYLGF